MAGHQKVLSFLPLLLNKSPLLTFQRSMGSTKHWNPKFKMERKAKFLERDLPIYHTLKKDKKKDIGDMTPDEYRMELKKRGTPMLPRDSKKNMPFTLTCTESFFGGPNDKGYEPAPGEGRKSDLSHSGIPGADKAKAVFKDKKAQRLLQKYDDFDKAVFAEEAQQIHIEANTLLQDVYKNQDRLHELVTERAFPMMVHGLERKTMRWQFVDTIEPPKVVQINCESLFNDDTMFGQVTVRLHTRQILAIYDRFGRLMYGDSQVPKSCIEYIVMEKWVSDTHGTWRVHGKITPPDVPTNTVIKTWRVPSDLLEPEEEESEVEKATEKEPKETVKAMA